MSLTRMPRRLLRDQAYEALLAAIVSGELAPGQLLRDAELAEQVGLSRTPVREALARLTDEGLVQSKPNAYTRVAPLDRRDCTEAFVLLRALHVLAAQEAVPALSAEDLTLLRATNDQFAAALADRDVPAALAADDDFHGVLVQASGNRTLAATIERLTPRIRRLEQLRFGSLPGRESVRTHARIIDACAAGDTELAGRIVHENWDALGRLVEAAFS
ncbi:MAG TPA: GntR family transcriptional regulator [Candidatus Nanopelagicales bacterium]|jgi:DNA-binding GntR family transcriptional regulator|nr:GntR family transcriptional regulator [Candidatus Nanopelagicales bacterium]